MPEIKNEYCQILGAVVAEGLTDVVSSGDPSLLDRELFRTWRERCVVPVNEFEDWITNGRGKIYFELSEPDQRKAFERNKLLGLIKHKAEGGI